MIIFKYCRKLNLAIVMTFPPFFVVVGNRPIKRNVFTSRALRQAPNSIFSFREPIWARGLLASFMCRAPPGNGYAKPFHPGAGPLPPSPPSCSCSCSCSLSSFYPFWKCICKNYADPPSPAPALPSCHPTSPSPPPPPPGNGYAKSFSTWCEPAEKDPLKMHLLPLYDVGNSI